MDEPEYIELGPHGIRYDREIIICPRDDEKLQIMSAWTCPNMSRLRQALHGSILKVTSTEPGMHAQKGYPISI